MTKPTSSKSDPESGTTEADRLFGPEAFARANIRRKFIQKVYGILAIQLALTTAICGGFLARSVHCSINSLVVFLNFPLITAKKQSNGSSNTQECRLSP